MAIRKENPFARLNDKGSNDSINLRTDRLKLFSATSNKEDSRNGFVHEVETGVEQQVSASKLKL